MSLIAAVIVVLGTANNSLFAQLPTITEKISAPLVYTSHIFERTLSDAGSTISQYSAAALTGAKSISENGRAILSLASGSQNPQEFFVDFEDESLPVANAQDAQVTELQPTPQTPVSPQPTFPPQVTTLEGSRIYVPETTYTTINSDAIEKKLLIQKDYFSKQIDRIYDRLQSTNGDLNDRIDVVGTGGSSGISFATIALGGTGISTVPSYGQLLMGDGSGGYTLIATSSLGISGGGGSSQWTTSGSDIYYTGGNVGIGTTTLNSRLTVEQTHDAQTVARIANYSDSANAYAELSVRAGNVSTYLGSTPQNSSTVTGAGSSGRGYVWSQATGANRGLDLIAASANSDLRFYTAGTAATNERMRITSTGDVGVGTINPVPEFGNSWGSGLGMGVVSSSSTATIGVRSKSSTGYAFFDQTNDVGRSLLFGTYGSSYSDGGANTWFGVSKPGNSFMFTYADSALGIGTFGNRDLTLGTNNLPRITVLGGGNVGIGTTSPDGLLHLSGNGAVPQLIISGTAAGSNMKDWRVVADSTSLFLGTLSENTTATGDYAIRLGREASSNDIDYIEFATNNEANKMRFDGAGNLGIGTTSPQRLLSLYKSTSPVLQLADSISGSGVNDGFLLTQAGLDSYLENTEVGNLYFRTSATNRMTIDSSGNVGIGTTSPNAKLSIYSGAAGIYSVNAAADELVLENSGSGGMSIVTPDASTGNIFFGSPSRQIGSQLSWNYNNLLMTIGTGMAGGQVQFLAGNAAEAMRINSSGNVGIGTTTPNAALNVNTTLTNGTPAFRISNSSTGPTWNGLVIDSNNASSIDARNWFIGANSVVYGDFNIRTGNARGENPTTSGTSRFYISETGNVGIGTTSPARKLHVESANADAARLRITETADSSSGHSAGIELFDTTTFKGGIFKNGLTHSIGLWDASSERLTVVQGGSIGIGTTTPVGSGLTISAASVPQLTFADQSLAAGTRNFLMRVNPNIGTGVFQIGSAVDAGSANVINLNLDRSGYVGIGTTTPGANLDVNGTTRLGGLTVGVYPALVLNNKSADAAGIGTGLQFKNRNDASNYMGGIQTIYRGGITSALTMMDFFAGGDSVTPKMTLSGAGNVGIGTTTPTVKLHAAMSNGAFPALASDTGIVVSNTTSSGSSAALSIIAGATGFSTLNFGDTLDENVGYIQYGHTNNYLAFGANTNEYMRLTSSGNIGIGTTSPSSILEVAASSPTITLASTNTLISGGASYGDIDFTSADPSGAGTMARIRAKGADNNFGGDSELTFWTLPGGGSMTERMRISSFGGVSIGSTTAAGIFTVENITTRNSFVVTDQALDTTPFLIDNAGNVGIGTSTPGLAKLIVEGTSGTSLSALGISNSANTANSRTLINFYDVTAENSAAFGTAREASATDWGLIFRTGSGNSSSGPSDRMYISAAGNVGIGTTTPAAALSVVSPGLSVVDIVNVSGLVRNEAGSALNLIPTIQAVTSAKTNMYALNIAPVFSDNISGVDTTNFASIRSAAMTGGLSGAITNTYGLYIENHTQGTNNYGAYIAGNVGVGTLTPNFALEVNGQASTTILSVPSSPANSTPTRWIGTSNQQSLYFDATSGTSLTSQGSMLFSIDSNANDTTRRFIFQTNQDRFSSSDTGAGTSLMVIQENGNVGIGTTSPTYKLEVAGDVGATSFINMSSRSVKKDINYVPFEQTQQALDKIKALKFATYRYITESDSEPLHLGLIAEESPEDILAPGGRGIDVYKMATFALQGIQSLIARIEKIEATLANVATGYTDIFKAKTVEVEQGITIKDSKTGEYYCIVVENGTMKNIPGKCGTVPVDSSNNENSSDSDDSADSDLSDSDDSEADAGDDEESGDTSTADDVITEDSESESDTDETNEQSEEGATESAEENTDEGTEGSSSETTTATTNESSQNNEGAEDTESTESSESSTDQSSDSAPAASSSSTSDSSEGSSDSSSSSSSESSSSSSESSTGSTDSGSSGTQE